MTQLLTDDDELELDDEQKRRAAQQTIASTPPFLPKANPSSVPPVPADMPAPEVGAVSAPPKQPTIADVAPYNPPAPRPESQAYSDWQAQDLAKHPVGQPRYHGLARVADTIAQMTWPGQAAEVGGEMGTLGAQAKEARLGRAAAGENTQIGYGENERKENAQNEEIQARTAETRAGAEPETINTPGGSVNVLTKNAGPPAAAIIAGQSRENVAGTNAQSRENVADTNAGSRSDVAKIMVGGKALGTKEIQGADGKAHIMMWNQATHTYDKDLGEAPPKQAASSAYANTRTVQLIDPETGLPTVYQYNGQTNSYDKPVGTSATGAYGHEMAQAGAVERAGTQLIAEIDANRDKIGDVSSLWNAAFMGTPLSDPYQSGLAAKIASFAALNPALHGARGVTAMKEFEQIYGSPINNPDSLIAAIKAGIGTASNIKGKGSTSKPTQGNSNAQGPANSTGPKIIRYDSQGNRVQ